MRLSGRQRSAAALGAAAVLALVVAGCSDEDTAARSATAAPGVGTGSVAPGGTDEAVEIIETDARGMPFSYPKGSGLMRSAVISLPPGQESPPARSKGPVYLHVLDGIVTITIEGDDATTVVTGRSAVLPARTRYVLANRDGATATFLTVKVERQAAASSP